MLLANNFYHVGKHSYASTNTLIAELHPKYSVYLQYSHAKDTEYIASAIIGGICRCIDFALIGLDVQMNVVNLLLSYAIIGTPLFLVSNAVHSCVSKTLLKRGTPLTTIQLVLNAFFLYQRCL